MKLKNKYMGFLPACFLFILVGCEDLKFGNAFLEKPVSTDVTIDTVFSQRKYAEQALAEVYHSLPDYLPTDGKLSWGTLETITDLGENTKAAGAQGYYTGTLTAVDTGQFPYRLDPTGSEEAGACSPMYGIRKAWIFLENVDKVPDMSTEEKEVRKAEAALIIAFHYAQMLRHYGGMPWIDDAYKPDDDMTCTRMTVKETVAKIDSIADATSKVLPWNVDDADEGRMTAAAALALKSRVRLFAASPLFNSETPFRAGEASDKLFTWYGDYDVSRWRDALDAGLAFLEANQANGDYYHLVNTGNPRDDFAAAYFNRCNRECIIVSHRFVTYDANSKSFQQIKFGTSGVTGNYADMFEMADGTPFSWDNPIHKANPFFDDNGNPVRDIRMYETLIVNGDKWGARTAEIWLGGRESCEGSKVSSFQKNAYNGYGMRKFQRDLGAEMRKKFYSCPLLRLPEIYLNIAEAMNELGLATNRDKFGRNAYDYVNLVRNRVEMPGLDESIITPGEKLREAILHERAVEFGFEEVRYFDINRWKRDDYLKAKLHRLRITKENDKLSYEVRYDMLHKRVYIERWDNRYFLIPIPQGEINKKYGLVQNPGWE